MTTLLILGFFLLAYLILGVSLVAAGVRNLAAQQRWSVSAWLRRMAGSPWLPTAPGCPASPPATQEDPA